MLLITLLITFLFAKMSGKYDGINIKKGKYINKMGHFTRAVLRFVLITSYCLTALIVGDVIDYVFMCVINFAVFWVLFDIIINDYIGKSPLRIGKTAKTDRMLRRISKDNELKAFGYKVVFVVVLFIAYIEYLIYI